MNEIKAIAGYCMLKIIAEADNMITPEEEIGIRNYVKDNFDQEPILDESFLKHLHEDDHKEQFDREAVSFYENSSPDERKSFLEYAQSLITGNNDSTSLEHQYIQSLKQHWKL